MDLPSIHDKYDLAAASFHSAIPDQKLVIELLARMLSLKATG